MSEQTVVRLSTPGEIAASMPLVIGFQPSESVVLASLCGPNGQLGLVMRLDLPDTWQWPLAADQLVPLLRRDGASAAVLVVYAEDGDHSHGVGHVTDALEGAGIRVVEALRVRRGRWSSYTCEDLDCCPPWGTLIGAPPGVLAAEAAAAGRGVLASRDELARSIAPRITDASHYRLAKASPTADVSWQGMLDALDAPLLTAWEAATLAVQLEDAGLRDRVLALAVDDERAVALLALAIQAAQLTPDPHAAPVCTVVGVLAWLGGNGALARVALDRALDSDGDYALARLAQVGLDAAMPPSTVRGWLSQVRDGLA